MLFLLFSAVSTYASTPPIQDQIDTAKPGDIIELSDGEYEERIVIDKPIHLVGNESVTLSHHGSDPIITIQSNDVTLENMTLHFSDEKHEAPAILVTGEHHTLKHMTIHTNSFGIQLDEAYDSTLSHIQITGEEKHALKDRQHGIDVWKSHDNTIHDTNIKHVKDGIYIEKSNGNALYHNTASHSRYGTHLMFTRDTILEENEAYENVSGMMIMGTNGTVAKQNTLNHNQENIQSLGLLLFDVKDALISQNTIEHNRVGMMIEDATNNELTLNHVQGNYIGVQLKRVEDNHIFNNAFIANVVQGQAEESAENHTYDNYWDDHLGLDITGDQKSNITYAVDPFFMNITNTYPPFQLLFQSPGMIFLEQLIQTPEEQQFVDSSPLMSYPIALHDESPSAQPYSILWFSLALLLFSLFIIYLGVKKQ